MAPGSEIDIEEHAALLDYLRATRRIQPGERPAFTNLRGGVSNRTVLVQREAGEDWVLKQALAKLRVEVDWFSAPVRIEREAAGLRWLSRIMPEHVPAPVFEDRGNHILAMSAIPQPHVNWKTALLAGRVEERHAQSFGKLLARIHNAARQFPALKHEFDERRFFQELRLEPYYGYAAERTPAASAFLRRLVSDTLERRLALTHGDYSPKNVLIYRDKLIILDYEVIHFGDPAFDVGFSLTHFLSKAHHLPSRRAAFLELARVYWRSYLNDLDASLAEIVGVFAARHTLACMLARVAGRSPLEYLDRARRERQKRMVIELIGEDIAAVPQLIDSFGERLRVDDE